MPPNLLLQFMLTAQPMRSVLVQTCWVKWPVMPPLWDLPVAKSSVDNRRRARARREMGVG